MRATKDQLDFIKAQINKFLPEAQVYLFGSRLDDNKHGGDIDILILSTKLLTFAQKIQVKLAFDQQFGEQKLDLVNYKFDDNSAFKNLILLEAKQI